MQRSMRLTTLSLSVNCRRVSRSWKAKTTPLSYKTTTYVRTISPQPLSANPFLCLWTERQLTCMHEEVTAIISERERMLVERYESVIQELQSELARVSANTDNPAAASAAAAAADSMPSATVRAYMSISVLCIPLCCLWLWWLTALVCVGASRTGRVYAEPACQSAAA